MADPKPFSLHDKWIAITGASSGIGQQCAITCSQLGARVILLARNEERLQETLQQMVSPENHLYFILDISQNESVESIADQIKHQGLKINGIIHSAGISTTLPFKMVKPEKMEDFFRTNVIGAINLTRVLLRNELISEEGASIIFISSVMGFLGENGKALYGMTKGALIAASKSLAIELAPKNIRVNCISPGVVETPMSKNAIYSRNEESLNRIKNLHPLGLGKPLDVANSCAFLLSDAARWITGTNLIVDGGYSAK